MKHRSLPTVLATAMVMSGATAAHASTIAITEFLADSTQTGPEAAFEWFELFNYGPSAVDMSGYRLIDNGGTYTVPNGVTLNAGEFLIAAYDSAVFNSNWGSVGATVLEYGAVAAGFQLSNASDGITVQDSVGNTVWNLGYSSAPTVGRAAHLAVDDFTVTDFGVRGAGKINFNGNDATTPTTLGYESNNFTADPFAVPAVNGDVGSPGAGNYSAVSGGGGGGPTPISVYFSEYIEGSGDNKALELFNGTGSAIDLGAMGYQIEFYSNGSASAGTTIPLSGLLNDGDVFVLADDGSNSAITTIADLLSASTFFNGNDAVVLRNSLQIVDVIGQVGSDPGSAWTGGGASTQNQTLRRKAGITVGDVDPTDAFDPSAEWDSFPQDTFDGLGARTGSPPTPLFGGAKFSEGDQVFEFTGYLGEGFAPNAGAGSIDSDTMIITGVRGGVLTFGGTNADQDHARGFDVGGSVTSAGVYGFELNGNTAFGVQPGGSTFNDGQIVFRILNDTSSVIDDLDLAYDLFVNNDEDQANFFNFTFGVGTDPSAADDRTLAGGLGDFASGGVPDSLGFILGKQVDTTLTGLGLQPGEFLFLRWHIGRVPGFDGGSDEFALDNISVRFTAPAQDSDGQAVPEPATVALLTMAGLGLLGRRRNR